MSFPSTKKYLLNGLQRKFSITATVRSQEKADDIIHTHPEWKGKIIFAIVADFTSTQPFDHLFQNSKIPFHYVIHTASPLKFQVHDIRKEMIKPAELG